MSTLKILMLKGGRLVWSRVVSRGPEKEFQLTEGKTVNWSKWIRIRVDSFWDKIDIFFLYSAALIVLDSGNLGNLYVWKISWTEFYTHSFYFWEDTFIVLFKWRLYSFPIIEFVAEFMVGLKILFFSGTMPIFCLIDSQLLILLHMFKSVMVYLGKSIISYSIASIY